MSVVDENKVDGIGISKDGEKLILLITDHLDWTNEYEHLIHLQNKINAYINFLENEQYKEVYPKKQFGLYCIEIHFKYELTSNCSKFIDRVNEQLCENNITIETIIV
ncbi:DUF6572 domain-containing protein [Ruminiclostridium josui]|uniref:DUF6572 domain-containing protein n=1 Tax=Ruminiclostridium josui TaxID=1499 RepID=UPI00046392F8|nr:DUF6572 domain-containing protein [Ruminiclostridium josui]